MRHRPFGPRQGKRRWWKLAEIAAVGFVCLAIVLTGVTTVVPPVVQQPPAALSPVQATGYFRVAQLDGRWWFVDPTGQPTLSIGVDDVSYTGDAIRGTNVQPYLDAVAALYDGRRAWEDATVQRWRAWAFNTLGAWSDPELWTRGTAYTIILDIGAWAGANPGHGWPLDVFAPVFEATAHRIARQAAAHAAGDPKLLGYFSDNELWWGSDWRRRDTMLAAYLEFPIGAPGRARALQFLRDRYREISRLDRAWHVNARDFEGVPATAATAAYRADADAFLAEVAARYFAVSAAAIHAADPHHLYLGARFQGLPPLPVLRAARAADVVSINLYVRNPLPAVSYVAAVTGRPVLVSEFSFRALDSGLPNTIGAGPWVFSQRTRALAYVRYVTQLLSAPSAVGYHWFRWSDEPALGRGDGENSNYGLVSIGDRPYVEFLDAVTTTNQAAVAIHSGLNLGWRIEQQVVRYGWGLRDLVDAALGGLRLARTAWQALRIMLQGRPSLFGPFP